MSSERPDRSDPVQYWVDALLRRDRGTLARLLSHAESTLDESQELVANVLAAAPARVAFRVAISGAPGVGKSTLIDGLGMLLIEKGLSVAVASIDPSSVISGGSVLGDKTRMHRLSADPRAFIRPTASGGVYGGIASSTAQSLELFERAGFDVIILETVGVGQSELDAVELVDCFVLVIPPMEGDEIQGIKRGITEHTDLILVNKADQDPALAGRTADQYAHALRLLRGREIQVLPVSGLNDEGLDGLWEALTSVRQDGTRSAGRKSQFELRQGAIERRVIQLVEEELRQVLRAHMDDPGGVARGLLEQAKAGAISSSAAAQVIVQMLLTHR
jgi:LAO/AO transport system kinase